MEMGLPTVSPLGRGNRRFLDDWHDRRVDLPDGDTLHHVAMAQPAPTRLEYPRTARHGAISRKEALRLLVQLGHADGGLRVSTTAASLGAGAVH